MVFDSMGLTEKQLSALSKLKLYEITETTTVSILVLANDFKEAESYAKDNQQYFDDYDQDTSYSAYELDINKIGTYYRSELLLVSDDAFAGSADVDAVRDLELTGDTLLRLLNAWKEEQKIQKIVEGKQVMFQFES